MLRRVKTAAKDAILAHAGITAVLTYTLVTRPPESALAKLLTNIPHHCGQARTNTHTELRSRGRFDQYEARTRPSPFHLLAF